MRKLTSAVILAVVAGTCVAASAATVTLFPVADTHLRKGSANTPEGTDNFLRVQQTGDNRALLRFDETQIANAVGGGTLLSANLLLFVESSSGWASGGRPVDAHRMTASWTENGATWNCADDTNTQNSQADCSPQWDGGTFDPTVTDTVVHTNDLSGFIQFNVTADVAAFLAGTPNQGWLVKKTDETVGGGTRYTSREGIASQEPRLVLAYTTTGGGAPGTCDQEAPSNLCVPGGGSKAKDCNFEWRVFAPPTLTSKGIPKNKFICYEGDPDCDVDPDIDNHSCTFEVSMCINNDDPRLTCTPSNISVFELKRPNPSHPKDDADAAATALLEGEAGSSGGFGVTVVRRNQAVFTGSPNNTPNLCSSLLDVQVPLRNPSIGVYRKGHKTLRVRAVTSFGDVDTDSVRLECRPSLCGNNVVDPNEQCDDGNRTPGDGCNQGCKLEAATPTATASPTASQSATASSTATVTRTPTPSGPTSTPTETGTITQTPTITETPTITQTRTITETATITPTGGAAIGTVVVQLAPGGGTCTSGHCAGGPKVGQTCTQNLDCNACNSNPPQGSCAFLQTKFSQLGLALAGSFEMEIGAPDGNGVAPIVVPQSSVQLDPVEVTGVGTACVTLTGDGMGSIDCDGGASNRDLLIVQDHDTTPGAFGNSGPTIGLPDDATCTNTSVLPDGSISMACKEGQPCDPNAASPVHPGICNSPRVVTQLGTFGAGDAVVSLPIKIGVIQSGQPAQLGPDGMPCTADDMPGIVTQSTIGLTTGEAVVRIVDANNSKTAEIGAGARTACTTNADCFNNGAGTPPDDQQCFDDANTSAICSGASVSCSCRIRCGSHACNVIAQGTSFSCANLAAGMVAGGQLLGSLPESRPAAARRQLRVDPLHRPVEQEGAGTFSVAVRRVLRRTACGTEKEPVPVILRSTARRHAACRFVVPLGPLC